MSQQINLYNREFKNKREKLTAKQIFIGGFVFCGLSLLWTGFEFWQLTAVKAELVIAENKFDAAMGEFQRVQAKLVKKHPDPKLGEEVRRLELLNKNLKQVTAILDRDNFTGPQGYSYYFEALANQALEGIWLDGFTIAGAGVEMMLTGGSIDPELLPRFLQGLTQEKQMQGMAFHVLYMNEADKDHRIISRPYVEFVIDTKLSDESIALANARLRHRKDKERE